MRDVTIKYLNTTCYSDNTILIKLEDTQKLHIFAGKVFMHKFSAFYSFQPEMPCRQTFVNLIYFIQFSFKVNQNLMDLLQACGQYKQANKQTSKQANKQTSKQANKQTSKQATSKQANKQTSKQANEQTEVNM